jgi:hypothetical protein
VNALANEEVGKYLNASFVSSFQKVGTFRIVNGQKQGGNVAAYFCDPDGRVLHAVAGPVNAPTFLREARWAVETYKLGLLENPDDLTGLRAFVWKAHAERLRREHRLDLNGGGGRRNLANPGRVHLIMAAAPLARLDQVYRLVFEKVLGETVSTAPVDVRRIAEEPCLASFGCGPGCSPGSRPCS